MIWRCFQDMHIKTKFIVDSNILEKNYNTLYKKLSKKYSGKDLELHLLNKLLAKGFNYSEIKKLVDKS